MGDPRPENVRGPQTAEERAEAARVRQALFDAGQEIESKQAAEMLAKFVAQAKAEGLAPEPLFARGYGGKGRARTGLSGWYLKNDKSLAVDTDGNYYLLTTDLGLLGRFQKHEPKPSPPPLILSKGARDGESMDLSAKLDQLLPSWRQGGG